MASYEKKREDAKEIFVGKI